MTKIEVANETWNPVTGCTRISEGCARCYAATMARRLKAMGQLKYANAFTPTWHFSELERPKRWKKPRLIFINSMSDTFHKNVPEPFIDEILNTIESCPEHTFQILTKRPERMKAYFEKRPVLPNLWLGVAAESQQEFLQRAPLLLQTPAALRYVVIEPMLGPVALTPALDASDRNLDWIICGGENGPGARPLSGDWVAELQKQCAKAKIPFFFKQWGGKRRKQPPEIDGKTYREFPTQKV